MIRYKQDAQSEPAADLLASDRFLREDVNKGPFASIKINRRQLPYDGWYCLLGFRGTHVSYTDEVTSKSAKRPIGAVTNCRYENLTTPKNLRDQV